MDDAELLERFERQAISRAEWTHRAHVRIAFLYLRRYAYPDALERVGTGIRALNAANRVEETPTGGYNETTTQAFLHLVAATIAAYGEAMPTPDSESFCDTHPQLMCKQVLRCFYSPVQRMHPDAKYRFVPPDLAPLPEIRG